MKGLIFSGTSEPRPPLNSIGHVLITVSDPQLSMLDMKVMLLTENPFFQWIPLCSGELLALNTE